jgi:hypothetical protein
MIEALEQALRASNEVRSLNFPHGLMQVSSRTTGLSALCARSRRVGEARETIFGGTGFFELGLNPLAFCDDRAQGDRRKPSKSWRRRQRVHSCDKTAQLRVSTD